MKNETITIANLKCGGCAATITKKLSGIQGVNNVKVDIDHDQVNISYADPATRTQITNTLLSIGYPEATAENGLLTQLKSYASCMVGRMSN